MTAGQRYVSPLRIDPIAYQFLANRAWIGMRTQCEVEVIILISSNVVETAASSIDLMCTLGTYS